MSSPFPGPEPARLSPNDELSLPEVALYFGVSISALRRRLRAGQLWGYKVPGRRGDEWRVLVSSLLQAGYAVRAPDPDTDPQVAELRRTAYALADVVISERRRAEETDRKLGEARMEIGRLRSQLRAAGIEPGSGARRTIGSSERNR